MVGLQSAGQGARGTDGIVAVSRDGDLAGTIDQVQVGHKFCDGCNHFGSQPVGYDAGSYLEAGGISQQPFAQFPNCPALNLAEDFLIDGILDDARDFILIVGHSRVLVQHP